jgi:AcrR family transcriptional regulator
MNPTPVRRDEIMAASAKLFATKGIASTTVRDIGEVTGLLSGSLYHYFKSKNAIVSEILQGYLTDIHQRFSAVVKRSPSPADTVRGLMLETLLVMDKASRAVRNYWIRAIEAGIADGTFRDDVPSEVFYRSVRDTLWSSMHWPNRSRYTTPDFAELLAGLFFQGLSHPKR